MMAKPRRCSRPYLSLLVPALAPSSGAAGLTWHAPTSARRLCFSGGARVVRPGSAVDSGHRASTAPLALSGSFDEVGGSNFNEYLHFAQELRDLTGDPLEQEGGRIVVARGNPGANLMLVGEAPGAEEDKRQKPFVGRSGRLLDEMLSAVGVDPELDVYITNIVRRRPINNRTPTPEEMAFYIPMLLEEFRLVDPKIIVTVGASSTRALLPFETRGITKARGSWADQEALGKVHDGALAGKLIMPWFHPSYLLRNAGERSRQEGGVRWHARGDLREVANALRRIEGPRKFGM